MAVLRQTSFRGQMRVDVPHLRLLESGVAGDFDLLGGRILSGTRALVVKGFTVGTGGVVGTPASGLSVVVAGSVVMHYGASESGSMFVAPDDAAAETLGPTNSSVVGSFTASTTNYLGLDLVRSDDTSTTDSVAFLNATTQQEFSQPVPLGRTLKYRLIISPNPFSTTTNVAPLAKIVTDASNNVVSVQDARNLFFRLGVGGDSPSAATTWSWASRKENPSTYSVSSLVDPFAGGDKSIASLKDWVDASLTRIWEIGGGEYWYSATNPMNMQLVRTGAVINTDNFDVNAGWLYWQGLKIIFENSTGYYNVITDHTVGQVVGLNDLAAGECLYVDVNRAVNGATITAHKASLLSLGSPAIPGSRMIIAWRDNAGNWFSRGFPFSIGTTLVAAATNLSLGIVELSSPAELGGAGTPTVPVVDATRQVVATGLTRSGIGAGDVVVAGGANDTNVTVGFSTNTSSSLIGTGVTIRGNRAAGSSSTDVLIIATQNRNNGKPILQVSNNNAAPVVAMEVDPDSVLVAGKIDTTTATNLLIGNTTATTVTVGRDSNTSTTIRGLGVSVKGAQGPASADPDVVIASFNARNNDLPILRISDHNGATTLVDFAKNYVSAFVPVYSNTFDRATAGTLSIGTSTATALSIAKDAVDTKVLGTLTLGTQSGSGDCRLIADTNKGLVLIGNQPSGGGGVDCIVKASVNRANSDIIFNVLRQTTGKFAVYGNGDVNMSGGLKIGGTYIDRRSAGTLNVGNGTTTQVVLNGNQAAAAAAVDIVLNSSQARNSGDTIVSVTNNGNAKAKVQGNGDVIIDSGAEYKYSGPKTKYIVVPAVLCQANQAGVDIFVAHAAAGSSAPSYFTCVSGGTTTIHGIFKLPSGATLTGIKCMTDSDGIAKTLTLDCYMWQSSSPGSSTEMVSSTVAAGATVTGPVLADGLEFKAWTITSRTANDDTYFDFSVGSGNEVANGKFYNLVATYTMTDLKPST